MSETKLRLSIILPGRVMISSQECEQNPKESYDHNKVAVTYKTKSGKPVREVIEFNTRKFKPAMQSINITKEAYQYMVSPDSIPETSSTSSKWNKFVWGKMSKKERIEAHLSLIAESLGGKVESYEIFDE